MQYIVSDKDVNKRRELYDFIHSNYIIKDYEDRNNIVENIFPIVVDLDEGSLWVCSSITCLACAAQNKKIINIEEFRNKVKKIIEE